MQQLGLCLLPIYWPAYFPALQYFLALVALLLALSNVHFLQTDKRVMAVFEYLFVDKYAPNLAQCLVQKYALNWLLNVFYQHLDCAI